MRQARWWRTTAFAASLTIVASSFGGCGDTASDGKDGDTARPGAAQTTQADPQTAQLKFARCMRQHGVDVSDPGSAGGNSDFNAGAGGASVQQAQQACAKFLRGAAPTGAQSSGADTGQQQALLAFARCMRRHGVDFPDPTTSNGVTQLSPGNNVNPNDPRVRQAQDACAKNLPGFDAGAPTGGPTP